MQRDNGLHGVSHRRPLLCNVAKGKKWNILRGRHEKKNLEEGTGIFEKSLDLWRGGDIPCVECFFTEQGYCPSYLLIIG